MAKKSVMTRAFRRLGRALATKDERAVDEALDDFEEAMEENSEDNQPEIEVHNHVPDYRGMDTGRGELPEKDPPGFDRRAHDEEEMPPWFKKHQEASDAQFKKMNDAIESLQKWAKEEEKEPEHEHDRRHDDRRHDDDEEERENLEMEDRHRDRRHDDDEEEMGEKEPEWKEGASEDRRHDDRRHDDRRHDDRRHDDRHRNSDRRDEANKEILGELEFEAPPGTGDRARKARDSRYLEEAFQDVLSKAEVLAPGIQLPTFDRAYAPARTFRQIHRLRQTALDLAYNKTETRGAIDAAMGGRTLDSKRASYAVTRTLFNSVASMIGSQNNRRATDRSFRTNDNNGTVRSGAITSIADLNKFNREKAAAGRR